MKGYTIQKFTLNELGASAIDSATTASTPHTIEVFNLQGILVRTITDNTTRQATGNLAPGTYIVVSTSETGRMIEKVIVK